MNRAPLILITIAAAALIGLLLLLSTEPGRSDRRHDAPRTQTTQENKAMMTLTLSAIAVTIAAVVLAGFAGLIPAAIAAPVCTLLGFLAGALSDRLPRLRPQPCAACRLQRTYRPATHILHNGRLVCDEHAKAAPRFDATAAPIAEGGK
jgi:hypothetical protein